MTIEQEAREAAEARSHTSAGASAQFADDNFVRGFLAAAEPRERELEALRAELNDRDTVPRSRYNACNQDWLDADKALTHLRDAAKREITDRDKEIASLRARVAELEGEKIPPARELLQEEGTLSAEVESLSLDWCNEITRSAPVAYCGLRAGHDGAHRSEGLPELCYTPNECAGRTSCPRRPACSS